MNVVAQKHADSIIIHSMDKAAADWNKGDLDSYMALYDPEATMMMEKGREGTGQIRGLYEKYYFVNGKPKQELSYGNYQITMLGKNYALLTGTFHLKATDKLKERSGTYSLVFKRNGKEWKILHDHSG